MPLFDYRCQNCSHEFEALQHADEDPLSECNICGEPALKKLAAAPAFTFKGGGWYKDGYGSAKDDSAGDGSAKDDSKKTTFFG